MAGKEQRSGSAARKQGQGRHRTSLSVKHVAVLAFVLAIGFASFALARSGSHSSHSRTRIADVRFSAAVNAAADQYKVPSNGVGPGTGSGSGSGKGTGTPSGTGSPSGSGSGSGAGSGAAVGAGAGATVNGTNSPFGCGVLIRQNYTSLAYVPGNMFHNQLTTTQWAAYQAEVNWAGFNASHSNSCIPKFNVSKTGWFRFKFLCQQQTNCSDLGDVTATLPTVVGNVTKLVTHTLDPTLFVVRADRVGRPWMKLTPAGLALVKQHGDLGSKLIARKQAGKHKLIGRIIILLHYKGDNSHPANNTPPAIYG
jgi:hypothetical protein